MYCKWSNKIVHMRYIIFSELPLLSPQIMNLISSVHFSNISTRAGKEKFKTQSHFHPNQIGLWMLIFVFNFLSNLRLVKIINRPERSHKKQHTLRGVCPVIWPMGWGTEWCMHVDDWQTHVYHGLCTGPIWILKDDSDSLIILGNCTLWEETKHCKQCVLSIKQMAR